MKTLLVSAILFAAACAAPSPTVSSPSNPELAARFDARVEAVRENLIALRREIHRHPDPSGEEARTAGLVADQLEALGFQVRREVGGHGVVATLTGGQPGAVIAFRADLDAVRTDAQDAVEFPSERSGVRHNCGHDIHTTIGMALAVGFAAIKHDFPGALMLVFQPAEETAEGSRRMIDSGALASPRPAAIFAYHTAPFEVGTIAQSETRLLSARDLVLFSADGPDADAAARTFAARVQAVNNVAQGITPAPIASDFVFVDSGGPFVDRGRTHWNATASLATDAARARMQAGATQAASEIQRAYPGAHVTFDYQANWIPGVLNDPTVVRRASRDLSAAIGADHLITVHQIAPGFSEDFGRMQAIVPGAMFFLGVSNESRGWVGLPHSPNYMADEEAIFVGSKAMARVLLDFMRTN